MFSGQASILFEMVCVDSSLLGNGMVHGFAKKISVYKTKWQFFQLVQIFTKHVLSSVYIIYERRNKLVKRKCSSNERLDLPFC